MGKRKKKPQMKVTSLGGEEHKVTTGKGDFLDLPALPKAPVERLRSPEGRAEVVADLAKVEIVLCQLRDEKRMNVVYWPSPTFNPDENRDYNLPLGDTAFALFHAQDEDELAYLIREVAAIKRMQHEMN